jgi:hypothetical protein
MWKFILESFENLSPLAFAGQILGIIGLIIIGIAYLFKKKTFLLLCTISFIFFILEGAFALKIAGTIVAITCFIRNILMCIFLYKWDKQLPRWIVYSLLGVMIIALAIYLVISKEYGVWQHYLPACLVIMSTFTQNSKNEYIVKIGATLHETGFLVWNIVEKLPFAIFREVILVTACFIGIILLIIKDVKNKKELEQNNL